MRNPFLALLSATMLAACAGAYTPKEIWEDADEWRFREDWFGGQLRAMGEPSLAASVQRAQPDDEYRLLVLPTFSPGFALRLTQRSDYVQATYVELDGAGGYDPGHIARKTVTDVPSSTLSPVIEALEEANFWNLPTRSFDLAAYRPDDRVGGRIVVCSDGTAYVIEVVRNGRYKLFDMHSCYLNELPAITALIEVFLTQFKDERADAGR